MSRIGIIANPHSKLNKRNPDRLALMSDVIGKDAELFITQSLEDLDDKIKFMSKHDFSTIAICGGDGTVSRTLTSIVSAFQDKSLPKIAVLRGGTMNVVASELKIYGRQIDVLKKFMKGVRKGKELKTRPLSTLNVSGRIGFIYADGSAVRILKEFYKKKSGIPGALLLAVKIISSFLVKGPLIKSLIKSLSTEAIIDSKKSSIDTLGAFAGTISKLPLGFPLLPLAGKKDGHFQANFITCAAEKLLWQLPNIMLKHKEGNSLEKYSVCCRELRLSWEESVCYTLDGELFDTDIPLTLKLGPAVNFIKL